MAFGVEEVTIPSGIVDTIQLALPHEQIGLSKRPSLCHGESVKMAPDLNKLVVCVLKSWVNFSLTEVYQLMFIATARPLALTALLPFHRISSIFAEAVQPSSAHPMLVLVRPEVFHRA